MNKQVAANLLDADSFPGRGNGRSRSRQLRETVDFYYGIQTGVYNPFDDLFDPATGDRWLPLYTPQNTQAAGDTWIFQSEQGLAIARMMMRYLAVENPFAINALENRVSYVVGTGMKFQVVHRAGIDVATIDVKLKEAVQAFIDDWVEQEEYDETQQEVVKRADRDGEAFLRYFESSQGLKLRFVEPHNVTSTMGTGNADSFGIRTSEEDVMDVRAYLIGRYEQERETVPANEIEHFKMNVDSTVKRGIPTLWAVRSNLHRAGKLLKNLSMLGQGRSSIAYARKHKNTTPAAMGAFADNQADMSAGDPLTGRDHRVQRVNAGRIIDLPENIDLEMPGENFNSVTFVEIVQAELRAAAARLLMPEYMLTSDASNGNYSSLLVAEGPPHKNFQRVQSRFSSRLRRPVERAIEWAMRTGQLPPNAMDTLRVKATPPTITTREPMQDAQEKAILLQNGIISRSTWQRSLGYDPKAENMEIQSDMAQTPMDLDGAGEPGPAPGGGGEKGGGA